MRETKEITLSLSVDEVNLILEGIGLLPFVRVFALVAKVQKQAQAQLAGGPAEDPDAR